jgi:hypothetical protein|tara:strand:- start:1503 stop:1745 length:243 start_codon:yes stop_codon:yes gene_type:complete
MKLSKKKLEGLKEVLKAKDEALLAVGNLEMRKVHFVSEAMQAENLFQEIRAELQGKYGEDVQVDLQTGEIENASNDLKKA